MLLTEKSEAPDFELPGSDGKTHKLSDHLGELVVLYFYPKDNTPGCTKEACDFRDSMDRLTEAGAVVYGISKDSIETHEKFAETHNLNFVLLSDEDLEVHRMWNAWGEKKMYGKVIEGVIRSTFLIDRKGLLVKKWHNVRVRGHVDKVLAEVEAIA